MKERGDEPVSNDRKTPVFEELAMRERKEEREKNEIEKLNSQKENTTNNNSNYSNNYTHKKQSYTKQNHNNKQQQQSQLRLLGTRTIKCSLFVVGFVAIRRVTTTTTTTTFNAILLIHQTEYPHFWFIFVIVGFNGPQQQCITATTS